MSRNLEYALDECLTLLQQGRTLQECLERYPQFVNELKPLLATAIAVYQSDKPETNPIAFKTSKQQMLLALDKKLEEKNTNDKFSIAYFPTFFIQTLRKYQPKGNLVSRFAVATIFTLVLIFAGSIFITSANSLPGDTFYPVKTFIEDVQYTFTFNPNARQELANKLQEKRQQEIMQILQSHRAIEVHFIGKLIKIEENIWTVEKFQISINPNTKIIGTPEVGKIIHVWGITQENGVIKAITIKTDNEINSKTKQSPSPMFTNTPLMEIMGNTYTPSPTCTINSMSGSTDTPFPSTTPFITLTRKPTNTPITTNPPLPTNWMTFLPGNTETIMPTDIPTYVVKPSRTPRPTRILPTELITNVPTDWNPATPIPPQIIILTKTSMP
jgi:hypothetical protein